MEKPAPADHPILDLLRQRWSPRAFDANRPVERTKLLSLLEAFRWAPSSFNEQPWHLLLATREEGEAYERLLSCLVPGNQAWAKNAPVLLIACYAKRFTRNDKPNRHGQHDVGLALGQMSVQVEAEGLAMHMMAGFDVAKTIEVCHIPETHEPITAAAIGYAAEPDTLDEPLREKEVAPRRRKPLADFVDHGQWGQTWPGLK